MRSGIERDRGQGPVAYYFQQHDLIRRCLTWLHWFFFAPRPLAPTVYGEFAIPTKDPRLITRERQIEALRVIEWARRKRVEGYDHDIPLPADASRVTKAWLADLDWIEIGTVAIAGVDAVVAHFYSDRYIPAVPPRDTVEFYIWRVDHRDDRMLASAELHALAARKAPRAVKDGDVKSGGPKKNREAEIESIVHEMQEALTATHGRRGPK